MTTARWRLLGAAGVAAVPAFALLPEQLSAVCYHLTFAALATALVVVLLRSRARKDIAWWLLSVSVIATTLGGSVGYLPPTSARSSVQAALLVGGLALCAAATLRFIALRTNIRDLDGVIDAVMLTCAIAVVLWEFVSLQHFGSDRMPGSLGVVLLPVLQSFAVALGVRFLFWGAWRLVSARLLVSTVFALAAGNLFHVATHDGAAALPARGPGTFWLAALLLLLVAAAKDTHSEVTKAALPGLSRVPYARLGVMALALVAPPAIIFGQAQDYGTGIVRALGSVVLTAMIGGRLFRVVIERERARTEIATRAAQQIALVQLGERALAGSELARLFDEAAAAIAASMRVDYAGIFEPVGAETLLLRAAVGWQLSDAQRSTVNTAEPFFGVPLVAGAPGYLDSEHHGRGVRSCDLLADSDVVAGVSVTIGTPAQRYGVLAVASRTPRTFSADDVTFLRAVANVLTAAIERTRTETEVRQAALHDPLTGLPNRVLLLDRLESALSRAPRLGHRVAVMFVDLDGFKQVNDTFGHRAGDQLLVAVARRLQQALRTEDTLTRLAGDEFVVICERLEEAQTIAVIATRIVETLREPFVLDDGTAQISGSVGIAVASGHGDDVDLLLREADGAMYRAKKAGKSRYEMAAHDWNDAARA